METNALTKEIENIRDQLVEKYRPEKIILFGSAAWGDGEEINDIDFFVVKDDVPYYGIDRMREVDGLVDRNMAVDMIVYKPEEVKRRLQMGDPFIKKIFKDGKTLYG